MIFKQSGKYPSLTEFIENGGRLEIGYIYELEVSAIMVDEGAWSGKEGKKAMLLWKHCLMKLKKKYKNG